MHLLWCLSEDPALDLNALHYCLLKSQPLSLLYLVCCCMDADLSMQGV